MLVAQELQPIIIKFPDFMTKIIQMYNNDSNFKSLCDDYSLSSILLQKYGRDVEADLVLEKEYASMCEILEKEITDYLLRK
ncbi:MAG: hypothetical protein IPK96_15675 [Flammeovirgaceae bacterium]|nr:hypothetical protein [Flammeovirgaceae bacterium]